MNKEAIRNQDHRLKMVEEGLASRYADQLEQYPYHNWQHCLMVAEGAEVLAAALDLSNEEVELVTIAGLYHDLGLASGQRENHEERGAAIARSELPGFGYTLAQTGLVAELVLATRGRYVNGVWQTWPADMYGKIICDADLWAIGRKDFPRLNENLRLEMGVDDQREWNRRQLAFIQGHRWHTEAARRLWSEQKEKNQQWLLQNVEMNQ